VQRVREEVERLRKEFESLRRAYDDRLVQLEQRLAQIGGGPLALSQEPVAPTSAVVPQAATPTANRRPSHRPQAQQQVPAGSSKVFNPDISVNGNFIAAAGSNPFATLSPMQLSEVEAAFQAVVDPYARADFFLAAGPDGLEVEEGYATFTSLPGSILLKVGKMRAQFGKMNTLHTHALPTVDRSLVTDNLVGGEEGLSDAGFSVSHLVKNPYLFLELTGEVFAGISDVFQSDERSKLVYVGRVRGYRDITESSNLDIGFSFATGPTRVESSPALLSSGTASPTLSAVGLTKHLYGVDATFRYRPLRRAILPAPESPDGTHLEPAADARRGRAARVRHVCERRVSVRATLVHRRPRGSIRADARCLGDRHGRLGLPHVLADGIQPDPRAVPAD
jgi:hypothetical protein